MAQSKAGIFLSSSAPSGSEVPGPTEQDRGHRDVRKLLLPGALFRMGLHTGILAPTLSGGGETFINPQQSPPGDINVCLC